MASQPPTTPGRAPGAGKNRMLDLFWDVSAQTSLLPPGGTSPTEFIMDPLTQEPMQNPQMLLCLHCVDHSSLAQLTSGDVVSCPICREATPVDQIVPHEPLRRFISTLVSDATESIPTGRPMCNLHPGQELSFWDMETHNVVCAYCLLLGPAKGHSHITLADALKSWRRDLTHFVQDAVSQDKVYIELEEELEQAMHSIDDAAHQTSAQISSSIDALIQMLEQRRSDLLADLQVVHARVRAPVQQQRQTVHDLHNKLRTATLQTYNQIQTCPLDELMLMRGSMDSRWMHVLASVESAKQIKKDVEEKWGQKGEKEGQMAPPAILFAPKESPAARIESFGSVLDVNLPMRAATDAAAESSYECTAVVPVHAPDTDAYLWPITAVSAVGGPIGCSNLVAMADSLGDIHLLDAVTLSPVTALHGHVKTTCSLATLPAPSSRLIVSGSYDGHIRVWDVDLMSCVLDIDALEDRGPVWSVAGVTMDDGSIFLCAGRADGTVRFYNMQGAEVSVYGASLVPNSRILSLQCAAFDAGTLLVGTSDAQVVAYRFREGVETGRASVSGEVWVVASSVAGEVYVGQSAGVLDVFRVVVDRKGRRMVPAHKVQVFEGTVRTLLVASGSALWASGVDGNVVVLDRDRGCQLRRILGAHASFVYGMARVGSRVFSVGDDDVVRVWDPAL